MNYNYPFVFFVPTDADSLYPCGTILHSLSPLLWLSKFYSPLSVKNHNYPSLFSVPAEADFLWLSSTILHYHSLFFLNFIHPSLFSYPKDANFPVWVTLLYTLLHRYISYFSTVFTFNCNAIQSTFPLLRTNRSGLPLAGRQRPSLQRHLVVAGRQARGPRALPPRPPLDLRHQQQLLPPHWLEEPPAS